MARGARLTTSIVAVLAGYAGQAQTPPLKASQTGVVFSQEVKTAWTLDYYAGIGAGLHPIAIVTANNGAGRETLIQLLAQAGFAVFPLNRSFPLASNDPAPLQLVERAIRYVRFHSRDWNADSQKVTLVGAGEGGLSSLLAGLADASGVMGSEDSVDRESARVRAVIALFGMENWGDNRVTDSWQVMLGPLLQQRVHEADLAQSSGSYLNLGAPSFLLLNGENDLAVPFAQSISLQAALIKAGLRCETVRVAQESQEWEHPLVHWLTKIIDQPK